jgi:hypothetical protein
MKERRKFIRFETELKAQYISQDGKRDWEKCAVVSLGRKGIGVRFQSREKVYIGSNIRLKIFVPEKVQPTIVEGVLKWIEKRENALFGGIESNEILDEMKFSKST